MSASYGERTWLYSDASNTLNVSFSCVFHGARNSSCDTCSTVTLLDCSLASEICVQLETCTVVLGVKSCSRLSVDACRSFLIR